MQDCQKQMELSWVIIAPVLTGCVGGDLKKKKHYSLQKPCVEYNIAIPSYDR